MDDALKFGVALAVGFAIGIGSYEIQKSAYTTNLENQNQQLKEQNQKLESQIKQVKEVIKSW